MAPQRLIHNPRQIGFILDGFKFDTIPRELVKSYLPHLWVSQAPFLSTTGCIDLDPIVIRGHENTLTAFKIICDVLNNPGIELGVASKLRTRLDAEADRCAHKVAPEHTMLRIFKDLADLLRAFSGRQELTYAMSEWFTLHAADTDLSAGILMSYVAGLDDLRVDMTGPLHALLRRTHILPSTLRNLQQTNRLRPKTIRKLNNLQKNLQKELQPAKRRHANGRFIAGGDLRPEDIEEIWRNDPDAITIDLGRSSRRQRHELGLHAHIPHLNIDDVYDDHHLYPHAPRAIAGSPWHDAYLPHRQAGLLGPPRMPSPMPMMHPGGRPQMVRHHTFH
ncbi:MAG: hypothetical protein LQ352_005162 [Teloschistes flavicans]|nr:MAG: hypothetical protein LQ352_005162 [Teloschistes flavicans]